MFIPTLNKDSTYFTPIIRSMNIGETLLKIRAKKLRFFDCARSPLLRMTKSIRAALSFLLLVTFISFGISPSANAANDWTSRTPAANVAWTSVAYGNSLWVAVGNNAVMTSTNGITWTSRTPAANTYWNSVAYGNSLWVAVGNNAVMTSTNGITWTSRTPAANNI